MDLRDRYIVPPPSNVRTITSGDLSNLPYHLLLFGHPAATGLRETVLHPTADGHAERDVGQGREMLGVREVGRQVRVV